MVDWVSLSIPVAYTTILVGSLAAFSWAYRRRQAVHAASLEPWFGQHLQRDIYYTLWNMEGDTKVPESVLKAALMRRAAEDVSRIIQMRSSKQALTNLLARGSVGDDLYKRFERAEKELEAELQDVVNEANALAPGWGQVIFQSANEMAHNARLRKRVDEIQSMKESEKTWWEQKRAATRDEFMKELESEGAAESKDTSNTAQDSRRGSTAPSSAGGEEEDGVIVEAGSGENTGPNTPTTAGGEGGKKKKKNKNKK